MSELVYYRDLDEQLLVFPILGTTAGIELKYINSISLVSELIPIPRSPKYIMGIVNIEGNIYPVIDLDILLSGRSNLETSQPIISLIDIKDTVFGIHTQNLPNVVPGTVGEAKGSVDKIPEKWVIGYTEHPEFGIIPIIDPKKFWVGMGESEVTGPLLGTEMTAADLYEDKDIMEFNENDLIDEEEDDFEEKERVEFQQEDEEDLEDEELDFEEEETELNQIEGISDKIRIALFDSGFKTIQDVANAPKEALTQVSGVGDKTATSLQSNARILLGLDVEEEKEEDNEE